MIVHSDRQEMYYAIPRGMQQPMFYTLHVKDDVENMHIIFTLLAINCSNISLPDAVKTATMRQVLL